MPVQRRQYVPGCEELLERHKQEFGEELGIYHPAASRDLISSRWSKENCKQLDKNNE